MNEPSAPLDRRDAAALSCSGVVVRFGQTEALAGLDLVARRGQITGLVGPNGAGKTTTLRLAAGLVQAERGSVRVLGLDPARRPVAVRRKLGFLPDRPVLPAHLAGSELLRLRAALYGLTPATVADRLDALTEELDLEPLLTRWCRELSHGQAQRIALAAVLLPDPPLLLVDEPMTALDLEAQVRVRTALRARADRGTAVVITTHTVDHIAALADLVIHLRQGVVTAERAGTRDARELEAWLLGSSS